MKKKVALSTLLCLVGLGSSVAFSTGVDLEKNIEQINSSIEKANYRGADEVVYKTLSVYSDNYDVQALAAVSWALQSKLELAQDQIDKLKNVIPKNSDLHFAQGVVFFKRLDSSNMDYRNKQESLTDIATREFKYAIQLDSNNYKAYNALGVIELQKGNTDEAKKNIEKALQLNPNYAVALDNMGSVYLEKGDNAKAQQYFQKAISLNPNSATAYYHLAQLEYAKGNYGKCLTLINKCLAWQGYSCYAFNLRGNAYKQQGNEAAAIASYKKAIEASPENLSAYANLASIYETRGDYELAMDSYKTILTIDPNSEQTLLKLADMYFQTGKYKESVAYYERVNNSMQSEALKGLASAYYAMAMNTVSNSAFLSNQKLYEASKYLDKAIEQNPNDLELYLAKAKLSALLNCPRDSYENLNSVVQKPCSTIDGYLVRGDANLALCNFKEGFADYKSAMELAKTKEEKLYLGELFMFSKLYDEAQTVFESVLKEDPNNDIAQSNISYIKLQKTATAQQVENANHFRVRNNTFFEREYLNKALKLSPYDESANILMGRLNQRQRRYNEAYVNYSVVVSTTQDADTSKKYTKRLNKVKSKIDRKIQREKTKAANEKAKAERKVAKEQEKAIKAQEKEKAKIAREQEKAAKAAEKEKARLAKKEQKAQEKLVKEQKKAQEKLAKEHEKALRAQQKAQDKKMVPASNVKKEKVKKEKVQKEKKKNTLPKQSPDKVKDQNSNPMMDIDYSPREM